MSVRILKVVIQMFNSVNNVLVALIIEISQVLIQVQIYLEIKVFAVT